MKVIVAGSRNIEDYKSVCEAVKSSGFEVSEVVSGTARGVDRLGERWATDNKIAVKRFSAKWDVYGRSAGYRRNQEMGEYADALVAIWDGASRGTMHMINIMKSENKPVFVWRCDR